MTSDRKNGLVSLHGCALGLTAIGVFFGWWRVVESMGWIRLVRTVNVSFYVVAISAASVLVYQGLGIVNTRLGDMTWMESIRHARQQVFRFIAVMFTFAFVSKDGDVSRAFLVSYLVIMAPVFAAANIIFPKLIIRFFIRSTRMRTVILGHPAEAASVGGFIRARHFLGIELLGWLGTDDGASMAPGDPPLPHLGTVQDLRRVLMEHDVAQVVISQSVFSAEEGRALGSCAEEYGCRVRFFSNVRSYFGDHPVCIEHEGAFTFATFVTEPLDNPVNRIMKRVFDVGVSLPIVVLILPPLTLMVWLMQILQSPGPVFHLQQRSGLNRRRFLIYKFRTMHEASSEALVQQARRNDSRVYPFGKFLRRTSLDEFPQFLNVLLGTMSVSGPRPHLLEHDEQFARVDNRYYVRQFVKPGITGLAQSKGFRGEISEAALLHQRIGYDLIYHPALDART